MSLPNPDGNVLGMRETQLSAVLLNLFSVPVLPQCLSTSLLVTEFCWRGNSCQLCFKEEELSFRELLPRSCRQLVSYRKQSLRCNFYFILSMRQTSISHEHLTVSPPVSLRQLLQPLKPAVLPSSSLQQGSFGTNRGVFSLLPCVSLKSWAKIQINA